MKRLSALFLILALLLSSFALLPANAADSESIQLAETGKSSGDYDYFVRGDYAVITDCRASGNVTIPETIDNYPVWEIEWNNNTRSFSTVTITKNLSVKGSFNSPNLTEVTFTSDFNFEGNIFGGCPKLTKVTFSEYYKNKNGVIYCGNMDVNTVVACLGGTSGKVNLTDQMETIAENAFENCTKITAVHLPSGVRSIAQDAFIGCDQLKEYTVLSKTADIGDHAIGYRRNGNNYEKISGVVIKGYVGSTAQTYAQNNGFTFTEFTAQAPEVTKIETVAGGVSLRWNAVEGFSYYTVFYKAVNITDKWHKLGIVKGTGYVDSTIKVGDARYYTVRGCDENGDLIGEYDHTGRKGIRLATPKILSVSPSRYHNGSFIFTDYNAYTVTDTDPELVLFKKVGGKWVEIPLFQPTPGQMGTFYDIDAVVGQSYTYLARFRDNETGTFSSAPSAQYTYKHTQAPKITSMVNINGGTKITWSAIKGAAKYRLFYNADGKWKTLATVNGTSYTDRAVKPMRSKQYTVRAIGANGSYLGGYCNAVFGKEYGPGLAQYPNAWCNFYFAPVSVAALANTKHGVRLKFGYPYGGYGGIGCDFIIYRKEAGGSYQPIDVISLGSAGYDYYDRSVVAGKTYTYEVRAAGADYETVIEPKSARVAGKSIKATQVQYPAIVKFDNLNNGVKFTWNKYPKAFKYAVFSYENKKWKKLATVSGNTYTDTEVYQKASAAKNQIAESTYTIRAIGSNGKYISAYNTLGWTYQYVMNPKITSISKTAQGVQLNWTDYGPSYGNPLVDAYRVYRKEDGGSFKQIAFIPSREESCDDMPERMAYVPDGTVIDKNNITFTDKTAKAGKTYTYTIRAQYHNESANYSFFNGKSTQSMHSQQRQRLTGYYGGWSITI